MTTGRFTSVDPIVSPAALGDPQKWNRYAYARNNPLRFVDPTGMDDEERESPEIEIPMPPCTDMCQFFHLWADELLWKAREAQRMQENAPLYDGPPRLSLEESATLIADFYKEIRTVSGMAGFVRESYTRGSFDFKNTPAVIAARKRHGWDVRIAFEGQYYTADQLGNVLFGTIAASYGVPMETATMGAAIAQIASFASYWIPFVSGGSPVIGLCGGDTCEDRRMIRRGYEVFHRWTNRIRENR